MQEFIPLEDDWSLLDSIAEKRLVPYQVGMHCMRRARQLFGMESESMSAPVERVGRRPGWPRDLG